MHQHTCICLCYEIIKVYVTDAFRCTGRYCFHGGPSFSSVVVCKWGLFQFKMTSLSRLKERKYCIKILHGIHLLNACTCTRHSYGMLLNAKIWHIDAAILFLVWPWGCNFAFADIWMCEHCFCLQKLNMAMPPCHLSSATERGKA